MERWALSVERSAFCSSALLHPGFPAALEHEHIRKLRFLAQPFGHFTGKIATLRAAIDNDLFPRRPHSQKLRQQLVPAIFVQRNRTRHMITCKLVIRASIDPDGTVSPRARSIDAHQFRRRNW